MVAVVALVLDDEILFHDAQEIFLRDGDGKNIVDKHFVDFVGEWEAVANILGEDDAGEKVRESFNGQLIDEVEDNFSALKRLADGKELVGKFVDNITDWLEDGRGEFG